MGDQSGSFSGVIHQVGICSEAHPCSSAGLHLHYFRGFFVNCMLFLKYAFKREQPCTESLRVFII